MKAGRLEAEIHCNPTHLENRVVWRYWLVLHDEWGMLCPLFAACAADTPFHAFEIAAWLLRHRRQRPLTGIVENINGRKITVYGSLPQQKDHPIQERSL